MYQTTQQFLTEWENEAKLTTKVIQSITPEALKEAPNDVNWNLGRIAYHLTETFGSLMAQTLGVAVTVKTPKDDAIKDVSLLADIYKEGSKAFAENIKNSINDAQLSDEIEFFGRPFTKAKMLDLTVKHQIHHRGQMTVLLRQAGLTPPGVYGPNKEEWEGMGLPPRD